jgi:AcrR family transcriptional regulator
VSLTHPPSAASAQPEPLLSRRARKKERTRHEIYAAAIALFAEKGFDAVPVEQICQAADVAKATFFLHFPTKSALLFEFSRQLAVELDEQLRETRRDAISELRLMLDLFSERWLEHGAVMAAMLREFLRTPESVLALEAEGHELRELVEATVRRGQARGELRRSVDARLAAAILFSTSFAILSGSVFRDGKTTPRNVRDQFLEAFLHGLVADAASPRKKSPRRPAASKTRSRTR